MRAAGAPAGDQRGDGPAADPPWLRGGDRERSGCCGAVFHQLGLEERAKAAARANIAAWWRVMEDGGLDAIIFNASGCGVALKDYEHLLRDDPEGGTRRLLFDATMSPRYWSTLASSRWWSRPAGGDLSSRLHDAARPLAAHAGKALPAQAGFVVREPAEAHICRSAGLYSILQPEISESCAGASWHIEATQPQIVASGNIACITHLAATDLPVVPRRPHGGARALGDTAGSDSGDLTRLEAHGL